MSVEVNSHGDWYSHTSGGNMMDDEDYMMDDEDHTARAARREEEREDKGREVGSFRMRDTVEIGLLIYVWWLTAKNWDTVGFGIFAEVPGPRRIQRQAETNQSWAKKGCHCKLCTVNDVWSIRSFGGQLRGIAQAGRAWL
ncbi:hypothetical protein FIBSPDRAFT_864310 [Athelia psychrophila]|uniref:Uncharacterized protein n=1 Tax=Athelia psychrophila TaxID=1759441 RepID=A0A166GKJ3_9AGAM|nr:hypothetical protein FIBSPDRAFT_864286 [Fibularhizoctonia sp. CBS 109695]KZP17933.1 hypothetical protein FIBSPDRAFT_864310 [Fibularhizoctonia sp. CBS 109695]